MRAEAKVRALGALVVSLLATLLLVGCGGGGGGDAGGGDPAYAGVTTQATITTADAEPLAMGAYQGGQTGQATISPLSSGTAPAVTTNRLLTLAALTRDLAQSVRPAPAGSVTPQVTISDTAPGTCGGSADIRMDVNDVSGNFSGSLGFSGYCADGTVLDGSAAFSGHVDPVTGEVTSFTLSFQGLTMLDTVSGQTVTLAGSESLTVADGGLTLTQTMDLVLIDQASGKTYWVSNYRLNVAVDPGGAYTDVSISGRFYDPDRGYVDVGTALPLHVLTGAEEPSAGILLFFGANNTGARLTVNGDGSFLIEADADGDGSYEWSITYTPT